MQLWETAAAAVLAAVNVAAFVVCAADKRAAVKNKSRVRESTLLALAFFGGAAGMYLAMLLFRHKTQKPKFSVLVPLLLIAQLALIIWILIQFG